MILQRYKKNALLHKLVHKSVGLSRKLVHKSVNHYINSSLKVCLPVFHRCRIELCLEAAGEVAGGAEAQQV